MACVGVSGSRNLVKSDESTGRADMRTGYFDLTLAVYVTFHQGESNMGTRDRQWIAWHCEYKKGAVFAAVCSADIQPRAVQSVVVE